MPSCVASRTRCVLFDLSGHERVRQFEPLRHCLSLAFSADGERLAAICTEGGEFHLAVCETEGKLVARSSSFAEPFYSVEFSPDGARIATGHSGGNVLLWQADTLQPSARLKSHGAGLQRVFFSPDGRLLGAGDQTNGDVMFWSADSGEEAYRYTFERGDFRTYYSRSNSQPVRPEKDPARFAFSPDGAAFLAGCHGGIIRLVSTGQDVRRFGDSR